MIATGGAMSFSRRIHGMGLEQSEPEVDATALTDRIESIKGHLQTNVTRLLESQGVRLISGVARFTSPHDIVVDAADGSSIDLHADAVLISTGSRPRIPEWCIPDGERILTTRDCYPPKEFPQSITVIGSGVTGVEFVHMFSSFGSEVTLVVSRQQVLPSKDPEVAAVLEADFLGRGVRLLKGARATSIERDGDEVTVPLRRRPCRRAARTPCSPSARSRTATTSALDAAGVELDAGGYVHDQPPLPEQPAAHLRRRRRQREAAAQSRSRRCRAARSPST